MNHFCLTGNGCSPLALNRVSSGPELSWIQTKKKANKKKDDTVTTGGDPLFPPRYSVPDNCISHTPSPGSSLLPPLVGQLLLGSCWWKGSPLFPLFQVGADPPGGICVHWCALGSGEPGLLAGSRGSCVPVPQLPYGKMQSMWSCEKYF